MTYTELLTKRIHIASGMEPADTVIKNCRIVNVFTREIIEGDIALSDGVIAGIGQYTGREEIDAHGAYALPGLIDSHIHIESSHVTPEEFSRLLVPHGTTTVIADPHEIVNVCGLTGLSYMLNAAEKAALDIKFMLPSCVPCTEWEHAGAAVTAADMAEPLRDDRILGLGEFMNAPGVIRAVPAVLDKLAAAKAAGKPVDGHAPSLLDRNLTAYASTGIRTDHEAGSVEEVQQRLRLGLYVMLRYGSACTELEELAACVTPENARRFLLCSDDCHPATIMARGSTDASLRVCVERGIDPITAVQMATLNAAECYHLDDRGAIAPGRRGDIVLVDDLQEFRVRRVWIGGKPVAQDGAYLPETARHDISSVMSSVHVKDFSAERLRLRLTSDHVTVMDLHPGTVLSHRSDAYIRRAPDGDFLFDPAADIVKMAVIERHHATGNLAMALVRGYGLDRGAIALTVAHDSHNIIAAGASNDEMAFAVDRLIDMGGGITVVRDGAVLEELPLPVAGLMSDQPVEWVRDRLDAIHRAAFEELHVSRAVDPITTLCFMALPVIPELKLTDMGLFDVIHSRFVPLEAEETAEE